MHLGDFYTITPKGYSEESINQIREEVEKSEEKEIKDESTNANVIMIMNESFSDVSKIENVEYLDNPMQGLVNLNEDDANCYIVNTVTPVLGGGTSLPEFEALTGLTSYYLEQQIYPYTSYIRNDMNSIVRVYGEYEYTTIGIHPYKKNFYNRNNVYKYLGFDQTIFAEDMENPEVKGEYISDNEFADQVIKAFEETEGNKFIFGVTMQNHMPYNSNKYKEYDIEIKSNYYSEKEINELRSYAQGVYDGVEMYLKLVDYLKNCEEPTILVMFGDHLPLLETTIFYDESDFKVIDYYTTPCIIWANYDINPDKFSKYMSPSNMSIKVLDLAGLDTPWYLKKFDELYKKYPAINNKLAISKDNILMGEQYIEQDKLINDCRILQYDLLIKKQYI